MNLPAIEAAANKLAAAAEWHAARTTFEDQRKGFAKRASDLRHIAMDAASAGDAEYPCEASLESVRWWLESDDALAAESYIPARPM